MKRLQRIDAKIYPNSHCLICGDSYGIVSGEHRAHRPSTCKACGNTQCWTEGLARGQCGVCYIGLLDAFSSRKCGYKGCDKEAIAAVPRKRYACKFHLANSDSDTYIMRHLAERDKRFREIDVEVYNYPILGKKEEI